MNKKDEDKSVKYSKAKEYSEVKYTDPELNEEYEFPGFYVGEQISKYGNYEIGDIVFVKKYNYKSGSVGSNHLFVIVDKNNRAVPIINFCMLISSNLEKLRFKTNMFLEKDESNNLQKDSVVKTDAIYKISNEEINYKIGQIDKKFAIKYKELYLGGIKNE